MTIKLKQNYSKMSIKMLIIIALFIFGIVLSQDNKYAIFNNLERNNKNEVYIMVKENFGKLGLNKDSLSMITGINKKYLTTGNYTTINGINICLPVNDKIFNFKKFQNEIFNDNIKTENHNIVIKLKLYFKEEEVIMAVIEKYICKLSN